jgi:hypothetical protein
VESVPRAESQHGEWACDWRLSEGGLVFDAERLEDTADVDAGDLGWK